MNKLKVCSNFEHAIITVDELVIIANRLKGMSRKESLELAKEHGLSRCDIDSLRRMLGLSQSEKYCKTTDEEREKIIEEYVNGEGSMCELARRHGLSSNSVQLLVKNRNITITTSRKWRKRDEIYARERYEHGDTTRAIAEALGKSRFAVKNKLERMGVMHGARPDKSKVKTNELAMQMDAIRRKMGM